MTIDWTDVCAKAMVAFCSEKCRGFIPPPEFDIAVVARFLEHVPYDLRDEIGFELFRALHSLRHDAATRYVN